MTSFVAALAVFAGPAAPVSDASRIDGRVAVIVGPSAKTVPTKFAIVRLVPQDPRRRPTVAKADASGLFSFTRVPRGAYVVRTTSCADVPRVAVIRERLPLGVVDGKAMFQTLVSHKIVVDHLCRPLVSNTIHIGDGPHETLQFEMARPT